MLSSRFSAFSRTDHAYPTSPDQSAGSSEILAPGEIFSDYADATPELDVRRFTDLLVDKVSLSPTIEGENIAATA